MSASVAVCMAALALNEPGNATTDEVDLVEINHFYDEQGRLVFDQVIFYDWCPSQSRYNICDYRLLKSQAQIPLRSWRDGRYVSVWHDVKSRDRLRRVYAKRFRETWTQYDPELVEREFLPEERRRKLRKIPSRLPR